MLHFVVFVFFGWKIVVHFLYLFIYFHRLIRCERARGLITTQTKLYIHVCQLGLANPRAHARIIYVYKLKHNKIKRSKCKNISAIIKIVAQNRSCNRCCSCWRNQSNQIAYISLIIAIIHVLWLRRMRRLTHSNCMNMDFN